MTHRIREIEVSDIPEIHNLYRMVSLASGGLARRPEEITHSFVQKIIEESKRGGLALVLEESGFLCGLIHASGSSVMDLSHVLGNLTIAVAPKFQGCGYGRLLFSEFLNQVTLTRSDIYRVELRARASSVEAIGFYKTLGFIEEGVFRSRIRNRMGQLEDGIAMAWFNPTYGVVSRDRATHHSLTQNLMSAKDFS